jgi:hypothetical protein
MPQLKQSATDKIIRQSKAPAAMSGPLIFVLNFPGAERATPLSASRVDR